MRPLIPEPWKFDPPAGLRIIDVRASDDLANHSGAWAALLLRSSNASPMVSYPQISAFFETQLQINEAWLCLFAYEGETMVGMLPLIAARSVGVPGLSVLLMKTPYDILHTSGVGCLTPENREGILDVFVSYLNRMPGKWPVIRMRELLESDPTANCLKRTGTRLRGILTQCGRENHIVVPADFESYHAGLSSNFKRQLKRGTRKLEELGDIRFLCRESSRNTAENMKRFEDVEDKGWKGAGNSSIKAIAKNSVMYALAAERFQREGWMEWNFIECGDKTIAAQFAVRIRRTLFLLKICYDDEYSSCSPGNLLIEKIIQNASETGNLGEINCVADCAWHRNWQMKERAIFDLVILPKIPVISPLIRAVLSSVAFKRLKERFSGGSVPPDVSGTQQLSE